MNRGDIYYVARTYQEDGSEQHAGRPAIIVSNNKNNENIEAVEVVYITTQPKKDLPTHVFIRSSTRPSTALCEQIHTVSKDRIGEKMGTITDQEASAIDRALEISLGLDRKQTNDATDLATYAAEFIKATTERDVYRELYTDLLASITKGGADQ